MIRWKASVPETVFTLPNSKQKIQLCWNDSSEELIINVNYAYIYGLGERYDGVNQNGRVLTILVEEKFCNQGNQSYCPAPFFFTDTGFSVCAFTGSKLQFDFTEDNIIKIKVPRDCEFAFNFGLPAKLIADYMALSGQAVLPPAWVFGPWISANHWNTQAVTEKQVELLHKYKFPASVLVLEAWSDEATFYIFNGAKYQVKTDGAAFVSSDFDYSTSAYWPAPKAMIDKLHAAGLHLLLWQVPVYKLQGDDEVRNLQNDLDRLDAVKRRLCVQNADGSPYEIPEGHWFSGSLIPDFTNPETCKAWFGKRQYLLDMGVDGFKADGGEFICGDDVCFYDGSTGDKSRNYYPQQYTQAYTKFLGDKRVLFSRAGFMGQHTTPCHWAGDQQSTNAELQHVLAAGLSAGMSGIIYWGFDIAGFAGPLPTLDLYRRATMFASFTPIMQWHSEPDGGQFKEIMPGAKGNNERSPWNMAAVYNAPGFVTEMRFWHWLRMNLQPYILDTAAKCAKANQPMMRMLVYDWPHDERVYDIEDEYLFGEALLVAPLLEENQVIRHVYLPAGEWYALFTGEHYSGEQTILTTPQMKFPVFVRGGYGVLLNASSFSELGQPIVDSHKMLLLLAGNSGKQTFSVDRTVLNCNWEANSVQLENSTDMPVEIYRLNEQGGR
ncbi:glycoside hydrolase family 31 protein [Amygdalobacter nucleatus]|uniref:Glycosyl hydrolase, family 31 n=1 Tax=Amygdalobacter nucleatus TaxID=3029274 RepID=A0A133YEN2_9FIRM|nr:TIM-barrel domain-containing protein [Amygdalobacter nucleatus]KXB41641.1 glycosyl hydrolase, family 31 [Amygdalobacter nucleatus]MDF0486302.1 glycoside hydrolase family 31 protein [Amygdalobacter nucleatus]